MITIVPKTRLVLTPLVRIHVYCPRLAVTIPFVNLTNTDLDVSVNPISVVIHLPVVIQFPMIIVTLIRLARWVKFARTINVSMAVEMMEIVNSKMFVLIRFVRIHVRSMVPVVITRSVSQPITIEFVPVNLITREIQRFPVNEFDLHLSV